jgi:hypothetical protein
MYIAEQFNQADFSIEYLQAMIDSTPCEYYARICAFIGA